MNAATLDPQAATRLRRRRLIISVVVVSLIIHFMGAIGAGIWVVARYFLPPTATFEVKKEIRIAAEEREHRMNMAEFDSGQPKPSFTDRMSTARPAEFSLPDLPLIPVEAVATLDPSDMVSEQLAGLGGMGGGSGTGTGGGGKFGGSAVNFFGISDMATRVIIVVDVSDSMFDRQPGKFNAVKQEASKLISGLGVNTLFNIIIYEGGSVAMFPEVLPATDANKKSAAEWVQSVDGGMNKRSMSYWGTYSKMGTGLYEGGGTRLDTAMKQAISMRPSTIFLITDGEINRSSRGREPDPPPAPDDGDKGGKGGKHQFTGTKITKQDILGIIRDAQKPLEEPAKIHVIHFLTKLARKDEEDILRSIARGNDGRFKAVKPEDY